MELDKYYKPSLEEFYTGFEYEEFHDPIRYKLINEKLNKWNKKVYDINTQLYYTDSNENKYSFFNNEIYKDNFRIKYLDEEDLKELGFEDIKTEIKSYGKYFNGRIKYNKDKYFKRSLEIYCSFLKNKNEIYCKLIDTHFKGNFEIYLKNKSELKKLLKQIKVNE